MAGAFGALLSGVPEVLAARSTGRSTALQRAGFILYAAIACVVVLVYWGLPREPAGDAAAIVGRPLGQSRRTVLGSRPCSASTRPRAGSW